MHHNALLLGIDVGTTNCKALVCDTRGRVYALSSAATPTLRPRPGWCVYDAEALWQTVVQVVHTAVQQVDAQQVRGVAVASMGEAGVLLDQHGTALGPIIAWHDERTVPLYQQWIAREGAERYFEITGTVAEPIFSLFKLMWLRDHAPEAYAQATRWLHVADYMAFRLCGAQATDYSLASRTMLFDLHRRHWHAPLVERSGVRAELLPEPLASGTRLGSLTAAAAAATGLRPETVVGVGGHDHICGAFAIGINAAGTCLDSIGTSEVAFISLDAAATIPHQPQSPGVESNPDAALPETRLAAASEQAGCSFGAHVVQNRNYAMNTIRQSGSLVAWADQLLAAAPLDAQAAAIPAGSLGVVFLPGQAVSGRSAFVGLAPDVPAAALGRAVYEGLAYAWRHARDQIEHLLGTRSTTIRLIGGGTRRATWMQIKADVLNQPLRVVETEEAVALGAALLGGIAAGLFRDTAEAAAACVPTERIITPDPHNAALYEHGYQHLYLPSVCAVSGANQAIADSLVKGGMTEGTDARVPG